MADDRKPMQNFNTDTMSGIFPGSRTMIYQRLLIHGNADSQPQWYQLQWYSDPTAAILLNMRGSQPNPKPVVTLTEPTPQSFVQRLHEELTGAGLKADACYICRHWRPSHVVTDDGLPAGRCHWSDSEAVLPSALATQSALSLACPQFQRQPEPNVTTTGSASTNVVHPRVPISAALDPDRLPFWPRLLNKLRRPTETEKHWTDHIIERSGVGAGTEPCHVCQGRLANLGAIAVASAEGDKQTLSIWRCRSCYTAFFNDWTDRWERLESLETEERYYRIAPAEAFAALRIIHDNKGGEHPGRRHDRDQQRARMLALVAGKQPVSHQVRQGR